MKAAERQRIAWWIDRDGQGEMVLWLDRAPDGVLELCDWNDCAPVYSRDIDKEVKEWDRAMCDEPGHLKRFNST